MKKIVILSIICLALASCAPANSIDKAAQPAPAATAAVNQLQTGASLPAITKTPMLMADVKATSNIPNFDHIVLMVLENEYLQNVIESPRMPLLNALAEKYVVLSNYFAVSHPSLPNYIAMVSGSTQNITSNCTDCFLNQPNLADEIEASGRTWKSYLEDMPSPCFIGNKFPYVQMFNPLLYFDSIRLDATRCDRSIVPLTQLTSDLAANQLPNFAFIMPNLCNSGHNCPPETADNWVDEMVAILQASPALGENSLIIITYDEGMQKGDRIRTRGQVMTVFISPMAQPGLNDPTTYSHYSLLKTILKAWNLPMLGETKNASTLAIEAPWDPQLGTQLPDNHGATP